MRLELIVGAASSRDLDYRVKLIRGWKAAPTRPQSEGGVRADLPLFRNL